MARRGIALVYGGGRLGLMGEVASSVLSGGGEVIGVIPRGLAVKEVAFSELADLRVVDTMHERKALMAELADGFITLPGGFGTLEETFEALTWGQLGLHRKPCGLLNVAGFYDGLVHFLDYALAQSFIQPMHRSLVLEHDRPEALLDLLEAYQPPVVDKIAWAVEQARRGSLDTPAGEL
jgi:uncharacterized protein (TIGR00730 family)